MSIIHPTAIVDPQAELAEGVEIGPWAYIGPRVRLGENCRIGPRVLIEGDTQLGRECHVSNGAVIGTEPQDLKYHGEPTRVRIGEGSVIREFVTINRACGEGQETVLGKRLLVMAYAHVAHNCVLEDEVIMANVATLAGHIYIERGAIIGGLVAIHQFCRVGRYAIIRGGSAVGQDVLPFTTAAGFPCSPRGLNQVGLKRRRFSRDRIAALRQAYRWIFRSGLKLDDAISRLNSEFGDNEDIQHLLKFIQGSRRGLAR